MSTKTVCKGYTLIELLMTISVLSVLMAGAIPAMSSMIRSIEVDAGARMFTSSLMLARSEAVKRNTRVIMCKSASGSGCEPSAAWEQGWIVFHDLNSNGLLDSGEYVLHRVAALPPSLRLRGNAPVSQYVLYTPLGNTKLLSGAFLAGTFTVCANAGDRVKAKQVVISGVGRIRVADTNLAQCV